MSSVAFNLAAITEKEELMDDLRADIRQSRPGLVHQRDMLLEAMSGESVSPDQAKTIGDLSLETAVIILRFLQALKLHRTPSPNEMKEVTALANMFRLRELSPDRSWEKVFPGEAVLGKGANQRTVDLKPLYRYLIDHPSPETLKAENALRAQNLVDLKCISLSEKTVYETEGNYRRAAFEIGILFSLYSQGVEKPDAETLKEVRAAGLRFMTAFGNNYDLRRDYAVLNPWQP